MDFAAYFFYKNKKNIWTLEFIKGQHNIYLVDTVPLFSSNEMSGPMATADTPRLKNFLSGQP